MAVRRAAAVALVFVAALLLFSVDLRAGKTVKPGDTYTSRTKLFQVAAPKGCSSFSEYVIDESNKKGGEFYEEAVFYVRDMGEVYHAGVRGLTPSMRKQVQQPDGPLGPPQLAWWGIMLHLAGREKATGEWKPLADPEQVVTRHGPGILSANWVQRGQFLEIIKIENGKTTRQAGPGLVVVLMVQSGEHLIYVTGQADASGGIVAAASQPDTVTPDCVQGRLREMIDSLTISRPLEPRS